MKVFNYGSINIDHVYRVAHIVNPGETISANSYKKVSGGKGANQSAALARAGAEIFHIGRIGEDGRSELQSLDAYGVNTDFLVSGTEPTGAAMIQVTDDGENSIVILGGANMCNQPEDLDKAFAKAVAGDIFLTQNETNDIPAALLKAKKADLTTCLNPAPFTPEVKDFPLNAVDILVLNETEAMQLSDSDNPQDALNMLSSANPAMEIILTLGPEGGIYKSATESFSFPAATADTVADTTAAGDCFIGYYLAGLIDRLSPRERLSLAAQASAIAVSLPGAMPSIPKREEVEKRLLNNA